MWIAVCMHVHMCSHDRIPPIRCTLVTRITMEPSFLPSSGDLTLLDDCLWIGAVPTIGSVTLLTRSMWLLGMSRWAHKNPVPWSWNSQPPRSRSQEWLTSKWNYGSCAECWPHIQDERKESTYVCRMPILPLFPGWGSGNSCIHSGVHILCINSVKRSAETEQLNSFFDYYVDFQQSSNLFKHALGRVFFAIVQGCDVLADRRRQSSPFCQSFVSPGHTLTSSVVGSVHFSWAIGT